MERSRFLEVNTIFMDSASEISIAYCISHGHKPGRGRSEEQTRRFACMAAFASRHAGRWAHLNDLSAPQDRSQVFVMFTELPLDSAWPPIFDDGPPIIHVDSLSPATLLLYPNGNPLLALDQM